MRRFIRDVLREKKKEKENMRWIPTLAAMLMFGSLAIGADERPPPQPTIESEVLMEHVNSSIKLYFVGRYDQSIGALRLVLKSHKAGEDDSVRKKALRFLESISTGVFSGAWSEDMDPRYWAKYYRQRMTPNAFLDFLAKVDFDWCRIIPTKPQDKKVQNQPSDRTR